MSGARARMIAIALSCVPLAAAAGCAGDAGEGALHVLIEAEDTITHGLEPGGELEHVVDGWTVSFDAYVVAIGRIRVERSDGEAEAQTTRSVLAVDLASLPETGRTLARFERLRAGRWDVFGYATAAPGDDDERDESVTADDYAALQDAEASFLVSGSLTKADGESCPPDGACRSAPRVDFRLLVPVESAYGPCQSEDGLPGAVINGGATSSVSIVVHGDHLFFDRFAIGAELIQRRAQWLADSDLDGDHQVTQAELESIPAAHLFGAEHYSLAGSPVRIHTAWDFVRAQLATVGHFQGEGECPWDAR